MWWCKRIDGVFYRFLSCISTRNAARDIFMPPRLRTHLWRMVDFGRWAIWQGQYHRQSYAVQTNVWLSPTSPACVMARHGDQFLCFLYCVSRHSVIYHSNRSTRADLFVYVCVWMCVLLMLRVLASSSRQFRMHSVRAEALLLTQLHVKHEGVAEAVHRIKTERSALTFLFLNIRPFNLMNAAQVSKCRPQSERITEVE